LIARETGSFGGLHATVTNWTYSTGAALVFRTDPPAVTGCKGIPMKARLLQSVAVAAIGLLAAPTAYAGSFTIPPNSTSAQTLGTGQSGSIGVTGTLNVSGSSVAVTISGDSATLTNLGILEQTGTGRAIRDGSSAATKLTVTNGSATDSTAEMYTNDADVIQMNKSGSSVTLNNYGQMISNNASAGGAQVVDFNAITTGANTVNNYATGVMHAYEADAVRPGVNGLVDNYGKIISTTTTGSSSDGVDAQTNSGVQIINETNTSGPTTGGLIEGGRHGITGGQADAATAFTMTVTNNVGATIQGDNGSGINIDGFKTASGFGTLETVTVYNYGAITGDGVTGDGDGIDVDGVLNLTNTGTIKSIDAQGSASEGLSVGGGTIINSGTIEGSVKAGNVTGAVGRGITLTGNDISPTERDPIYADAIVTNQAGGKIIGDTDSGIAVVGFTSSGHTVTIDNQAGALIQGGGATTGAIDASNSFDPVSITNAGTIDGSSSGKAIVLGGGDNTVTISGGAASVKGDMSGGVGGVNKLFFDIGHGNSFSYSGAVSNFATAEVKSGTANLGGSISAPVTVDAGAYLSPGASGVGSLAVGGLTLTAGGGVVIDLDPAHGSSDVMTVNGAVALNGGNLILYLLSAPTPGESFNILLNDGSDGVSGEFSEGTYALGAFDGREYEFKIDYAYNADGGLVGNDIRLTAVPEPATWVLMALGGLIVMGARPLRRATA
jgi:hypothetical protein